MDLRQVTINTYNQSARELAEYFRGIGPRKKYIDLAFQAAGNPANARVVEIGCGDGRDAKEIIKKADWYEGFDVSKELIALARDHAPEGRFVVADAVEYSYPQDLTIVFAFASLLHLSRDELKVVFKRVHESLVSDGIFYISLKYSKEYEEKVKEDKFGKRLFYFYNPELIKELAGDLFEVESSWRETHGNTEWFEIILKKSSR